MTRPRDLRSRGIALGRDAQSTHPPYGSYHNTNRNVFKFELCLFRHGGWAGA
jgi:hypothetical protein